MLVCVVLHLTMGTHDINHHMFELCTDAVECKPHIHTYIRKSEYICTHCYILTNVRILYTLNHDLCVCEV